MKKGILIISLDFELYWGMHDVYTLDQYWDNLNGTRDAIDRMLKLFERYHIHVTWATVGFLFATTKNQLKKHIPNNLPTYLNEAYSPYQRLQKIGENEIEDPFHFAKSVLRKVDRCEGQEIGTHTFSHYYCLEKGQTPEQFSSDLEAAIKIAAEESFDIKSIVFPRNQINKEYLSICEKYGIQCYRGNPQHFIYHASSFESQNIIKKMLRLGDSYFNITGHHTYSLESMKAKGILDVKGSHFFRPYNDKLPMFNQLRLKRIKNSIAHAVKHRENYHLWWHPHNFGKNIEENLSGLEEVLKFAKQFIDEGELISLNMGEVASLVQEKEQAQASQSIIYI